MSSNGSGGYDVFHNKVKEMDLDLSILNQNKRNYLKTFLTGNVLKKEPLLEDVMIENSSYARHALKRRLLHNGMLHNICSICGLNENWNNQKLVLQLDHINGQNNDNRIENLRIVCPNCHSQLKTFSSKRRNNKLKKKEEMEIKKENFKKQKEEHIQNLIRIINNSDIDFTKFGWVKKLSLIIKKKHQKTGYWLKKYMPELYEKAFKKNIILGQ